MSNLKTSPDVKRAMSVPLPIVALESTVLTHGLPRPQNLYLARDMEQAVRENGATPATIGFLDGYLHIGLSDPELERLANEKEVIKVGPRDFATVSVQEACGGTTVAGTMLVCRQAGLKVFATDGSLPLDEQSRAIEQEANALAVEQVVKVDLEVGLRSITVQRVATLKWRFRDLLILITGTNCAFVQRVSAD